MDLKNIICKKGLCAYKYEGEEARVLHLADYEFLGVFTDQDYIYIRPMKHLGRGPVAVLENVRFLDAPLGIDFLILYVRGEVLDGADLYRAIDAVERTILTNKPEFAFNRDIVYALYVKRYGREES